ncbi:MAG: ribonuclease H-like domain-containing protein, partial [Candidatus Diapherotrites archaeon]|nr:ribonuclease H-like domain-containing protein [Candidatus Diapherotrites archaeon]
MLKSICMETTGILLDADYFSGENKNSIISLFVKTKEKIEKFTQPDFHPYFYAIVDNAKKRLKEIKEMGFGQEKSAPLEVIWEKKENAQNSLKIFFKSTQDLVEAREAIKKLEFVEEIREYDIPFTKRFLIDNALEPMNGIKVTHNEKNEIKKAEVVEEKNPLEKLKMASFDIETYSPERFSNPEKDPIISISLSTKNKTTAFLWKIKTQNENAQHFESEKKMILGFFEELRKENPDIIVTYNGDLFDFPYIKKRCSTLGIDLKKELGYEMKEKRKGLEFAVKLKAVQHVDAYQLVRILNRFGSIKLIKFDLESVSEALFRKPKEKVTNIEINQTWESGKGVDRLIHYNKEDAEATLKIAATFLDLFVELSRLVHSTLFDSTRASASQLVEDLLIEKSFQNNFLIPNKPTEGQVKARMLQTFKGGYVKEPIAGLHENIAVLDFRSLHPSIMIAHNISPEQLKCEHESCRNGKNLSPDKDWFCEKNKGFLPMILEEILQKRVKLKQQMKNAKQESQEHRVLDARQHALKILLNSHYGYLGYARSRWYSRESARAITAWSRHYIREINHKVEKAGFTPLYTDTDSSFLIVPKEKTKKDVLDFVKNVNSELPGAMELEFEGIYRRGIFVTRKVGGAAAKKRYALMDFEGNLTIVGFEYVRRDWANIAKKTQREVLHALLSEGNAQKAIKIVKEEVKKIKEGKDEK